MDKATNDLIAEAREAANDYKHDLQSCLWDYGDMITRLVAKIEDMEKQCPVWIGWDLAKSGCTGAIQTARIADGALVFEPLDSSNESDESFLIEKRGLYYRPNAAGYTGRKSEAGRYPFEEAVERVGPNGPDGPQDGMGIWRESEAPEHSSACPWDVRSEDVFTKRGYDRALDDVLREVEGHLPEFGAGEPQDGADRIIDQCWRSFRKVVSSLKSTKS